MRSIYFVFLIVVVLFSCIKPKKQIGFADVIDKTTYKLAKTEIDSYAYFLGEEVQKSFVVLDKCKSYSITVDRFYYDFGLEFKCLKKDDKNPLYHYYSLLFISEQKLHHEKNTGIITVPADKDKYEQI